MMSQSEVPKLLVANKKATFMDMHSPVLTSILLSHIAECTQVLMVDGCVLLGCQMYCGVCVLLRHSYLLMECASQLAATAAGRSEQGCCSA